MNHYTSETFDENARQALADPRLHASLSNLAKTFGERRRLAVTTVEDWEALREQARQVKEEALLHLDKYLEEFVANAEQAGAHIHWARNGEEACLVVLQIARERGACKVVKSKS